MSANLPELLARAVSRLLAGGIHDESLAIWKRSRGVLGIGASESLVPVGRAWRLGVLLLDRAGRLYSTGEVTRAVQPGRAAVNRSTAGEQRRAIRAIAARGNFSRGEVINHGWQEIPLDSETLSAESRPLLIREGAVFVRFGDGELSVAPLETYLRDRIDILFAD